ncbi:flagellar hook assembly protein FlgD [Pseudomonas turukhanskensis]|jgi:flagellar basal-body rod modification protein FlgD|uniref:Basal-body rod modification protein FlgD n=1 Tax=Pseudomonas turukhanskensis TaxID=1806536 RepID=A0A9W6K728_9PSED|nr:flagellar hook assembly protein FlgD [Pseudomonas turukhanskensis]GLK89436.1 basal-body rod modification protein FlgD [Pseudomonas turukhanskensis]
MAVDSVSTQSSVLDQYAVKDTTTTDKTLGKDQFLQLLVAQMNNQNPLDPQTNSEFVAQLAQFTQVESLDNLNTSVESILSSTQSSQALQASSLVGRKVILSTDTAVVDTSETFKGSIALTNGTDNLYVNVLDSKGNQVSRINLGQQKTGQITFMWDGKDSSGNVMAPGTYSFDAIASVDGKEVAMGTSLPANVDSVTLGINGGEMLLNLAGLGSIGISKVQVIGQ